MMAIITYWMEKTGSVWNLCCVCEMVTLISVYDLCIRSNGGLIAG